MTEQTMSQEVRLFRRALGGAMVALGLLIGSLGAADQGLPRVLELVIGLVAVAAAFTHLPGWLASRYVERSSGKHSRFWLIWMSGGSVIVPLIAAAFPVMGLAAGVPLDADSAALIIGPAIGALLNLIVLIVNLVEPSTT